MSDHPFSGDKGHILAERLAKLSPEKRNILQSKLASKQSLGNEIVAQTLNGCGITHIYGVAGKPTQEIMGACSRHNIRPIGNYHQSSAVCMALGQNYQEGRLVATALTSAGPAATNTITGLLVAKENGWPVIVLGGQKSSFQKFDAIPLVSHVTKQVFDVSSPKAIRGCIQEACEIAVSGRPGPVYLQLHEDALTGYGINNSSQKISPSRTVPQLADEKIDRIATAITSARRPALLLGEGIRWSVDPEQLLKLIEKLQLPFITSPMGRGFIPENHPLCFNQARTSLQAEADFVLILGARMNWIFRHGSELSKSAHIVRADFESHKEDKSAIEHEHFQCDPSDVVKRLLETAIASPEKLSNRNRNPQKIQWHKQLQKLSTQAQIRMEEKMDNPQSSPMSPYRMMKEIRDAIPRETICITDGNISMMVAQQIIPAFSPGGRMDAGASGCMGVGIPFGIGAKIARPNLPVVVITGDYAFSLNAMEMEPCVRHGIPIIVIVANNQGNNGAIKQNGLFPGEKELVTMFSPGLEYDQIMKLFGGRGTTVRDPEQLKITIEKAIAEGLPTCINVEIDPNTPIPNAWGEQSFSPSPT